MLTVDYDRLGVGPGTRFIDIGSGPGRHSFEAIRRGSAVIAFDLSAADLAKAQEGFEMLRAGGEFPAGAQASTQVGTVCQMPYETGAFDVVLASEILEHVPDDDAAISEIARVTRPGGQVAVTVPRWFPEWVCWKLSDEYHANEGGHIRIYRQRALRAKLVAAGLVHTHTEWAHGLHSPFWWLKCAVGVNNEQHWLVQAYHKFLVWDLLASPASTRMAERILNPLLGKSMVLYFTKPEVH